MNKNISVENYKKINSVTFGDLTDYTTEGHTYYMNTENPDDIILESINPDGVYVYDIVLSLCKMNDTILPIMDYLGVENKSIFNN